MFRVQVVNKYIDEGIAELIPGGLFIDEVPTVHSDQPKFSETLAFIVQKSSLD